MITRSYFTVRWLQIHNAQWLVFAGAPLLSAIAWWAAGDDLLMRQPALTAAAWLLSIACCILGSWPPTGLPAALRWLRAEGWILAALFFPAFLLRVIALRHIPWLFTGDEGAAALFAARFVSGEVNNLFITGWFSFPSFFFFLESVSLRMFGQTVEAARIPAALAGALSVVVLYGFARLVFDGAVGLAAAGILLTSHFHIHFSRIALQNVWDGLTWTAFSLAFFWAWRSNQRLGFTLAGIVLGFAPYFYASGRVLFLLLAVWLALALFKNRAEFRQRLAGLFALALSAAAVLLPLAFFFMANPGHFMAPFSRVSVFGGAHGGAFQWSLLGQRLWLSAQAYTSAPIQGVFYNPETPILLPLPALLFGFGVLLVTLGARRLEYAWLLVSLAALTLTNALSDPPNQAQRLVMAAPLVALFVVIPLARVWTEVTARRAAIRPQAALIISLVVGFIMLQDVGFYFGKYTPYGMFSDRNTEVANRVVDHLRTRPDKQDVYFIGLPRMGYFTHELIPYLLPDHRGVDLTPPLPRDLSIDRRTTFVLLPEYQAELATLQNQFPGGAITMLYSRDGSLLFTAYEVDAPPEASDV